MRIRLTSSLLLILLLFGLVLSGCSAADSHTLTLTQTEYDQIFSGFPNGPDGYYFFKVTYASDPPTTSYVGSKKDLLASDNAVSTASFKDELIRTQEELYGADYFSDPSASADTQIQFERIQVKIK